MPQPGQSMEEGTIVTWQKQEGDSIEKGEVLLEIETDKAMVEVESPQSGTLRKIFFPEGTTVAIQTVIALVGEPEEEIPEAFSETPDRTQPAEKMESPPKSIEPSADVIPVLMPQAGQSMEEGTIVKWMVQPGDQINLGDILLEVETDKAVVEVEATDSGRLSRIVVNEGETVEVLKPIAYLSLDDSAVEAYLSGGGMEASSLQSVIPTFQAEQVRVLSESGAKVQTIPQPGERTKASPAARKFAREQGIDLATVTSGSGPQGRILSTEVLQVGDSTIVPIRREMSSMRRAIAKTLQASKQNIPHFYIQITIDASPLLSYYKQEKTKYRCSVNDVITSACAVAIREFPGFRSRVENNEIVELPTVNIGIAVGTDNGLVVPVLLNADQMELKEVAAESRKMIESARQGKVAGMGQGVFTITNLGMFGIEEFSAIINPPEAAILAVGAAREGVMVQDGEIRAGHLMTLNLSCDHRIIDGLMAAQFLVRLKDLLENPSDGSPVGG